MEIITINSFEYNYRINVLNKKKMLLFVLRKSSFFTRLWSITL